LREIDNDQVRVVLR